MTNQREHQEQVALFQWAAYMEKTYPALRMMYAIPNGGLRNKVVAAKLKAEGVKAGVPDICLPVARGGFHGLYIEMKVGKNKLTDKQRAWHKALGGQGNLARTCYGWDEARKLIVSYLSVDCRQLIDGSLKKCTCVGC